jgi:hypothetical protein
VYLDTPSAFFKNLAFTFSNDSKIPTKREKKFRQTFEKMEGFSFVAPVTGLNIPNTGKEEDDEEIPAILKCD